MKQAGLQSEIGRIEEATEVLMGRWARVQETWRDGNARSVEENAMLPLRELVQTALPAIAHLSDVIQHSARTVADPKDRQEGL